MKALKEKAVIVAGVLGFLAFAYIVGLEPWVYVVVMVACIAYTIGKHVGEQGESPLNEAHDLRRMEERRRYREARRQSKAYEEGGPVEPPEDPR